MTWIMWYHLYKFKKQRKHDILFIEKKRRKAAYIPNSKEHLCLGKWVGLEIVGDLEIFNILFFPSFQKEDHIDTLFFQCSEIQIFKI